MENSNSFIELFDKQAMDRLLKNENYYKTFLSQDKEFDAFVLLKKYAKRAHGPLQDRVLVKYNRKHGRGRQFAQHALSLQSFPRLIRGTLSKEIYYDLDFVNCHPTIIKTICQNKGFLAPFLCSFVDNRDQVINEILAENEDQTADFVKESILSLIYGGLKNYEQIQKKTSWLKGFKKEIGKIHKKVSEWFPEEYELQKKIKKDDYFNIEGATLSSAVCVVEDELLEIMLNYLKIKKYVKKNAVLTFDGIMVLRNAFSNDTSKLLKVMKEVEKLFIEKGYNIKLKSKEFATLPDDIPDEFKQEEKTMSNYIDSEYYWFDFMQDMSVVHESYTSLCELFESKVNDVMIRIYDMDDHFIRKISKNNLFNFDKHFPNDVFSYWDMKPDGKPYICKISLKKLLITNGLISSIKCYNSLNFEPVGAGKPIVNKGRDFNTWAGFQAKLVPEVDMNLIEPILHHIRKVWCSDSEEIFNYIISWFKVIFTNPTFKSKVAIVLKSSEKQIGKGILLNEFIIPYIFGRRYAMSVAGINTITDRFNGIMMNKLLINCDELSMIDNGSFCASFDVLKKRITDNTIRIEIKGAKSFIYPDYCNYIMCTNHDFTIRIEKGDARYLVLDCSPCYKMQFDYFQRLVESCNQQTADHFFSYVCNFQNSVDVRDIPMTDLKKEMIVAGLRSPLRFLMEKQNDNPSGWTSADALYCEYKSWCMNNAEKQVSSKIQFGKEITPYIEKKKSNGVHYKLDSINVNLG